jgi:flavin-dependent dehydrogenase
VSRDVEAPGVRRQDLGQITTFGRQYTTAQEGFGSLVMPTAGRATVMFTLLSDRPGHGNPQPAAYYLDEFVRQDPRVSDLLAGATTVRESATTVAIHDAPQRVARTGFMSIGDAATPAGHVGILGSIWLGRQAALVASEGLDSDDVSGSRLNRYGRLFHNKLVGSLRSERELMLGLARLPDQELDHLAHILKGLPIAAPFFTGWQGIPWEAMKWLLQQEPYAGSRRRDLLEGLLAQDTVGVGAADSWSTHLVSGASFS